MKTDDRPVTIHELGIPDDLLPIVFALVLRGETEAAARILSQRRIADQVKEHMARLDGSTKSSVMLLTGLSAEEIDRLGGLGEGGDDADA